MCAFLYKGDKTREISFPLGGIGTGCIGLAGNGRLIDWEIFNRPNKGSTNGFSHFAIRAERDGQVLDARVLNGHLEPPYSGSLNGPLFQSFGFGPPRDTMAGVPHFEEVTFRGEFPFAELSFEDQSFPGKVSLLAFNPFIPLNDKDSSIPAAFFEIAVENLTDEDLDYTICLSVQNPLPDGTTVNRYVERDGLEQIHMGSDALAHDDPGYGDLTIATNADDTSYQEYWYRGSWFDNLTIYWRDLNTPGRFQNRNYPLDAPRPHRVQSDLGLLAAHVTLQPGESRQVRFVISWSFPNCHNYWNPDEGGCAEGCCEFQPQMWKNYYVSLFADSSQSAAYSLRHWDRLYKETRLFKEALFSSTIPDYAMDSVSANLAVLKTPTCLRLEDGTFYGFEGCHPSCGCCEGSCTHVWNYAYALPFLFPKLERSMRHADFTYNMDEHGGMSFRLQLPLGRQRSSFRPCADGQFGGLIKAYRDWKISGDTAWLQAHWPAMKKMIAYAWSKDNYDGWDRDKDGVLEGRQHHTLDMELFGPNSWLTGFYLAALKVGAEIAEFFGEEDTAEEYRSLFERGKGWVDANLFNGEYYQQMIDLRDKTILERYSAGASMVGDTVTTYWDSEHEEIKYQIAEGCEIDQLHAQWQANNCGLGDIFDQDQRRIALRSLYKYNFKESMREVFNACRLYCLNDEAGLLICSWPETKYEPAVPLPYAGETQNGYEYGAALLMIQEGLVDEGLSVVKAIRDRYDGEKRNPWNEFECGSNYARSMASYGLLLALSGFEYNLVTGLFGFDPVRWVGGRFKCFWSLGTGWGTLEATDRSARIAVLAGSLTVSRLRLPFLPATIAKVFVGDHAVVSTRHGDWFELAEPIRLETGEAITAS